MPDTLTFLEELASAEPVPGGGSVAALQTAMGAALIVMVTNLTIGRKKYAGVEVRASQIRSRAQHLCADAYRLVTEDIESYRGVAAVFAMPKGTEEEKSARHAKLQEALKVASGPPLRTMEVAGEVAQLARELVEFGNPSAISDVGSAAFAAYAGFHAAQLNVEINVHDVRDQTWVDSIRSRMASIPSPDEKVPEVASRVRAVMRGETS
jgi:methenyltetrahydrofolate cyclohydrolase